MRTDWAIHLLTKCENYVNGVNNHSIDIVSPTIYDLCYHYINGMMLKDWEVRQLENFFS